MNGSELQEDGYALRLIDGRMFLLVEALSEQLRSEPSAAQLERLLERAFYVWAAVPNEYAVWRRLSCEQGKAGLDAC